MGKASIEADHMAHCHVSVSTWEYINVDCDGTIKCCIL